MSLRQKCGLPRASSAAGAGGSGQDALVIRILVLLRHLPISASVCGTCLHRMIFFVSESTQGWLGLSLSCLRGTCPRGFALGRFLFLFLFLALSISFPLRCF